MTSLKIEPLKAAHADLLFDAYQDPRMYQYIPGQPPPSLDSLRKEYSEFEAGAPADSNEVWLNWVIKRRADQQLVGTLQATLEGDGKLWIGYVIASIYWGQGVARAALGLLLAELRERFPNREVLASVDIRNSASIKVLERNGFRCLRTEAAEIRGEPTEDYIYSLQL